MLTLPEGPGPAESGPPLRICTICDGIDALLRMAAWVVTLPHGSSRTDFSLSEALDHLNSAEERFDMIVLAADSGKPAAPKLVNAVLKAASDLSPELIVLLAPEATLALAPQPGLRVIHGPPFPVLPEGVEGPGEEEPQSEPATTPRRHLLRLPWRRIPEPPPLRANALPTRPPCRVIAVQPLSGGCGATTFSVNLASELARMKQPPAICLIELNLQFGGVSTYLDLAVESRVLDAYRNLRAVDGDAFQSCLQRLSDQLTVFPAPAEILPTDAISGADLRRILALARDSADLILIDMPHLIADWSETIFSEADRIFAISTPDVRSAQNAAKLRDLMQAEHLADGNKLCHILNRAPARPAKDWEAEKAGFETGLGAAFCLTLPEGGPDIVRACNAGTPLWREAPSNPLRTAILEFCEALRPELGSRPAARPLTSPQEEAH